MHLDEIIIAKEQLITSMKAKDGKIRINANIFMYPMPVVLVDATVNGKPNFMVVGWVSRVNANPPMLGGWN